MELSMQEIALIHIACRAFMKNELPQKDMDAYESLLCRLSISVRARKTRLDINRQGKTNQTIDIPIRFFKTVEEGHE